MAECSTGAPRARPAPNRRQSVGTAVRARTAGELFADALLSDDELIDLLGEDEQE
jgi:hypothetical protein